MSSSFAKVCCICFASPSSLARDSNWSLRSLSLTRASFLLISRSESNSDACFSNALKSSAASSKPASSAILSCSRSFSFRSSEVSSSCSRLTTSVGSRTGVSEVLAFGTAQPIKRPDKRMSKESGEVRANRTLNSFERSIPSSRRLASSMTICSAGPFRSLEFPRLIAVAVLSSKPARRSISTADWKLVARRINDAAPATTTARNVPPPSQIPIQVVEFAT